MSAGAMRIRFDHVERHIHPPAVWAHDRQMFIFAAR